MQKKVLDHYIKYSLFTYPGLYEKYLKSLPDDIREIVMLGQFEKLSESKLKAIDHLAELLQNPDENFDELQKIWQANKEFRLLKGALL